MQIVDIHIAASQLSDIVHGMNGDSVMLSENGQPIAMLVPCPKPAAKEPRKPGIAKGLIVIHDNFDDPLPEEFRDAFGL